VQPRVGTGATPRRGPQLEAGVVLSDRFEVVRYLASGGMGDVYEVTDRELGLNVALKTLRSDLIQDDAALGRLRREVQLARKVTHPNVCRIFDVVTHRGEEKHGPDFPVVGYTMELLGGTTLGAILDRNGPYQPDRALPIVAQMASGLDAAHRAGVIHRDFKSANVIVEPAKDPDRGPRVVVTDFGLARQTGHWSGDTGDNEVVVGTADYMAPEQIRGGEITPATDIYALGVVLYEMLTGARPHPADSAVAVMLRRLEDPPRPPRELVDELPHRWERAILKCLEADPRKRFGSAMEVVSAVTEWRDGELGLRDVLVPAGDAVEAIPAARAGRFVHGRRWLLGTVVALTAVFLGGLWFAFREPPELVSGTPIQLTTDAGLEVHPSVAPVGDLVAWSSDRTGAFEIHVARLSDGGGERRVTDDGQMNFQPAFSPDGRRLVYHSARRGGLWIVDVDGGPPERVTDFGSHPSWSPDGSLIAFQSEQNVELSANASNAMPPSTLWLVRPEGGAPWRITEPGQPEGGHGAPEWWPTGDRIVFAASNRRWSSIWSLEVGSGEVQPLVDGTPAAFDPVVMHDGRTLLFSAVSGGESYGVWQLALTSRGRPAGDPPVPLLSHGQANLRHFAVTADGTALVHTSLTTVSNLWELKVDPATATSLGDPVALTRGTGRHARPHISPDGRSVAFDRWRVGAAVDVWLLRGDGGDPQPASARPGPNTQASWMPGAEEVVFLNGCAEGLRLVRQPIDGGEGASVAEFPASVDSVRLSPDGRRIAYHAVVEGSAPNVWVSQVDGSEARQVTDEPELAGFPAWAPDSRRLAVEVRTGDRDQIAVIDVDAPKPQLVLVTDVDGRAWPYSWSPDGRRVAFAGQEHGVWNLYWVDVETRQIGVLTTFTEDSGYVRYPDWSPTGERIVFERAENAADLWRVELRRER
jgi:Tol biopolymer transport system component/tRNA A-37 threonylcarbamoyl transferase component Bud32